MERRVVVTGVGVVSPVGVGADKFWENIKAGKNGIDYIKRFDTEKHKTKLCFPASDFKPEDFFEPKRVKRMSRFCQMGLCAASEAIEDSGILPVVNAERLGVNFGSGIGGMSIFPEAYEKFLASGPRSISPFFIPMLITNILAGEIAIEFKAKGICTASVTACATGAYCIGEAYRHISHGYLDAAIAGASEAAIEPVSIAGFSNMHAMSTVRDFNRASVPFDAERSGFVMGEGAGALILEEYEHAVRRGARIHAEIIGYGASCDASHITMPAENGEGAARSMRLAIEDAGIDACQVSYINAHGTGTQPNDLCETLAIKDVFGDYAYKIPVNSTKSMIGHALGAAGAIEAVVCIKTLQEAFVHPTINLLKPDPKLDLDYVPNVGRNVDVIYALSNSLGFGGHNASLIFKKFEA